jgi:hypothetical protein
LRLRVECTLFCNLQIDNCFLFFYKDRPFNLQGDGGGGELWFVFRSEISFFLSRKARIFFPEFNTRLYDKNSESDYFFSSTKIRIFFQQNWESEYLKKKKTIAPPWKLNDPFLCVISPSIYGLFIIIPVWYLQTLHTKRNINKDGQQSHQYQQSEKPHQTTEQ